MNPLIIILGILLLNLAALSLLMKHRRTVRHHRASMPVIGSDPKLTEAFHKRLKSNAPLSDWLNTHNLRAKVTAWMRSQQHDTDTTP